jgi:hypothetical protein
VGIQKIDMNSFPLPTIDPFYSWEKQTEKIIPFQQKEEEKGELSFLNAAAGGEVEIVSQEERTDEKVLNPITTKLISRTQQ